jgi:hypothetical protein
MTAFNVVRFRVKPGLENDFIDAHKASDPAFDGLRRFSMVDTGPGTFCIIGEWETFDALVAARPSMIGMLDRFRHMLEDFGNGIGVTDPVSGSVVLDMGGGAKRKAKKPAKRATPAAKKVKAKAKPAKAKPAKKAKRGKKK